MPKGIYKRIIGVNCGLLTQGFQMGNKTNWKGGKIERRCKCCGKTFYIFPYRLKKNGGNFCSYNCAAKNNRNVKGKHWRIKDISKMNKAKIGKKRPPFSQEWKDNIGKAQKGEKCHFWKDGKSLEPYSVNWTETLRKSIRERDKYICQLCGKIQGSVAHDVHHIDYNKKNCSPYNLITLCHSCNSKVNSNRNKWSEYFMKILISKQKYGMA